MYLTPQNSESPIWGFSMSGPSVVEKTSTVWKEKKKKKKIGNFWLLLSSKRPSSPKTEFACLVVQTDHEMPRPIHPVPKGEAKPKGGAKAFETRGVGTGQPKCHGWNGLTLHLGPPQSSNSSSMLARCCGVECCTRFFLRISHA